MSQAARISSGMEHVALLGAAATGSAGHALGNAIAALCARQGIAFARVDVSAEGRIPADAAEGLASCDLLIDVLADEADLKAHAIHQAEPALSASTIVASVAFHRCIAPLAKASGRPGNFAGLVFLSASAPDAFTLVEIVRGQETSDETIARLQAFVARMGWSAIVVNDSPGFYSRRVSGSYLNEAMALVGEGVRADLVESTAVEIGMQPGPLATLDEVSLKLSDELLHQELHDLEHAAHAHEHGATHDHGQGQGHDHDRDHDHDHDLGYDHEHKHDHDHEHEHVDGHGHDHASAAMPVSSRTTAKPTKHVHKMKSKRMPEPAVYVMEKMAHGFRRMGRKFGAGFYDYEDDGTKSLWTGLKAFERRSSKIPIEDIKDRLLFIQALETIRCLDEGVVSSVADANAGSIKGWRFPVTTGGTAQFVNHLGVKAFVERARELAQRYGERFSPPHLLVDLADRNVPLDDETFQSARAA